MTPEQFDRLIGAIEANTQAVLEMAKAATDMADQSAALIELVASTDGGVEEAPAQGGPELDLAGRPIL